MNEPRTQAPDRKSASDTDAILDEIARTRRKMDATLFRLEARLRPRRLLGDGLSRLDPLAWLGLAVVVAWAIRLGRKAHVLEAANSLAASTATAVAAVKLANLLAGSRGR